MSDVGTLNELPDASPLEPHAGCCTRMGGAFVGQRAVFRGHDLHADLAGLDWVELPYSVSRVCGVSRAVARAACAMGVHELPGRAHLEQPCGRPGGFESQFWHLATAAALAVSRPISMAGVSTSVLPPSCGGMPFAGGWRDLEPFIRTRAEGASALAGYGRPIAAGDERLAPMLTLIEKACAKVRTMQTALDVEQKLQADRWRLRMNYAALAAALTWTWASRRASTICSAFPAFLAGMQPVSSRPAEKPAGSLMPPQLTTTSTTRGRRRVPGLRSPLEAVEHLRVRAHDPPEAGRLGSRCPGGMTARGCPRRTRSQARGKFPAPGTGRMPQREVFPHEV